jgi:DNA-binding MarR family transcriptional regulator
MTQMKRPELPIGYWLKRADNLLTEHINKVQEANGVSRFEWQVLNTLNETGGAGKAQLFEVIGTFVDAPSLDGILTRLTERGWVEQGDGSKHDALVYRLTTDGRRQHGVILGTQKEVRQRAMQGISAEEYAATVQVLQRIVQNLEAS